MTFSPTMPYDAPYWGYMAFGIIGILIGLLLCCGCIAKEQTDSKAWRIQRQIQKDKYNQMKNDPTTTEEQWKEFYAGVTTAQHGGIVSNLADSIVYPLTHNPASDDLTWFFYHSSSGRLTLLSIQGALLVIKGLLMLVFSGLAVNYITSHIIPTFINQAQASLLFVIFLFILVIIVQITSDQYNIFLEPRLGHTGVIERPSLLPAIRV